MSNDQTNAPAVPTLPAYDPGMLATLSPETKANFGQLLSKQGHSAEAIAAALNPKPTVAPEVTYAPALTPEAATAAAVSRAYAPPATPNEYEINIPSYGHGEDTADLATFMSDLKAGFHAAAVPANIANSLAQTFFDAAQKWPEGEEEQLEYLTAQQQKVKGLNPATREDLRKYADIGQAALKEIGVELYSSGSFSTPEALYQLAAFGRIVEARTGAKK